MEDPASGNEQVLLPRIRALARRGATVRQDPDGAGTIEHSDGKRKTDRITPQEFLSMLDAGWLRMQGEARFVISRRGVSALRAMLNKPPDSAPMHAAATPTQRAQPAGGHPLLPSRHPAQPGLNTRESPLAWLRQRRDKDGQPMISAIELDAGERLRADFELAQLTPRTTASWDPAAVPSGQARGAPGAGLEMADVIVAARQRVEAALKAVGPDHAGVLLDVCCFLKGLEQAERNGGWPRRAGKVVLQLGLRQLARHYGLDRRNDAASGSIRSWGAAGYRPAMDAGCDAAGPVRETGG